MISNQVEIIVTTKAELRKLIREEISSLAPGDIPIPDHFTYDQIAKFHGIKRSGVWNWTKKGKRSMIDGDTYILNGSSNSVLVEDYLKFKKQVWG